MTYERLALKSHRRERDIVPKIALALNMDYALLFDQCRTATLLRKHHLELLSLEHVKSLEV